MSTLLLRLAGPMQSWGTDSKCALALAVFSAENP